MSIRLSFRHISGNVMYENSVDSAIKGIKYVAFYEASGYGTAARRYMTGVKNMGIPFTWTPMVKGGAWGMGYQPFLGREIGKTELAPFCNSKMEYDTVIVHTVPEYYPIWSEKEAGKRIIGMTVWETDRIPEHWLGPLHKVHRLLVPTEWNKKIFRECGITTSIDVVPHIFEDATPGSPEKTWEIESNEYVFYTIGTWTARKAIWNTIRSYLDAFAAHDRTVLIIKTTRRDFTKRSLLGRFKETKTTAQEIVNRYPNPAKIRLVTEELDEEEILQLHSRGDCYVSLCRSEGWGLGAFDAAGFGKPVIITGFGGQTEYLPEDLTYFVDYEIVPVLDRMAKKSYSNNQNWSKPSISHASELMRYVFEHQTEAGTKGARLRKHIRKNFNELVVTKRLISAIEGG